MTKHMTRTEAKVILLESLLDGPKLFHLGRCPVDAVELAMEMSQEELVSICDDRISITNAGRIWLVNRR